jgi:hypothetical protein
MSAIEEIERTVLRLPLEQRFFLVESLLSSLPPIAREMTAAEEAVEVDHREQEIETGKVQAVSEAEFWQH